MLINIEKPGMGMMSLIAATHSQHIIIVSIMIGEHYLIKSVFVSSYLFLMQAYEQGIFYPRSLFLFYGWYADNWWVGSANEGLSCSQEDRERVVQSGLAIVNDEALSDCSKNISTGIVRYM
jgi:hypothetical protein